MLKLGSERFIHGASEAVLEILLSAFPIHMSFVNLCHSYIDEEQRALVETTNLSYSLSRLCSSYQIKGVVTF